MSSNKINIDEVNIQLADQLRRINSDITPEDAKIECMKAKAMQGLAQTIFNGNKIILDAYKLAASGKADESDLNEFITQKQIGK